MNNVYHDIDDLYKAAGIVNFEKLPDEPAAKARFAILFKLMQEYLDAAKIQGFVWEKQEYYFKQDDGSQTVVSLDFDKHIYLTLLQRYKELTRERGDGPDDVPYDIDTYITEINTGAIDADYMNTNFKKWLKQLQDGDTKEAIEQTLNELHKSFASMSQEEQKYAKMFLHDVESGEVKVEDGKTLKDYITEYQVNARNDQIHRFAVCIGVDEEKLRAIMALHVTDATINEFGRFDELKASVDLTVARQYFERIEGKQILPFKLPMKVDTMLRKFILADGFEV